MTACGAKIPAGDCPGKRNFSTRLRMVTARLAHLLPLLTQHESHGILQLPLGFLETLKSSIRYERVQQTRASAGTATESERSFPRDFHSFLLLDRASACFVAHP